jgi:integrase
LREAELKIQLRDKKLVLSSEMTFRVCFDHYLVDARPRLGLSAFDNYEVSIKRDMLPCIGDKKLKELVKDDFQKVYDAVSRRGLAATTVRTLHYANRSVITWAMKKRLLSEDILRGITLRKIPKPQPEFLTYEETQAFLDAAHDYWYGNAFKFQFVTGLRNQELMALKWEDIDFETSTMCISRACCWVRGGSGGSNLRKQEKREPLSLTRSTSTSSRD